MLFVPNLVKKFQVPIVIVYAIAATSTLYGVATSLMGFKLENINANFTSGFHDILWLGMSSDSRWSRGRRGSSCSSAR